MPRKKAKALKAPLAHLPDVEIHPFAMLMLRKGVTHGQVSAWLRKQDKRFTLEPRSIRHVIGTWTRPRYHVAVAIALGLRDDTDTEEEAMAKINAFFPDGKPEWKPPVRKKRLAAEK